MSDATAREDKRHEDATGTAHVWFLKHPTLPIMRGAFVVRLGPKTETARGQFEGSVEEVDTGNRLKFRSTEELLEFLGQSFAEASRREAELNQRKQQQDDG
jgi:hypothetical protein